MLKKMEALFRILLRAPLANARWSWGSVRTADKVIFLRVWQDEKIKLNDKYFMRLTAYKHFVSDPKNLGWKERLRHVELMDNGATAYMVMCEAIDPLTSPREVKDFNKTEVFHGGEIVEFDGDRWLEIKNRVLVSSFMI